MKIEDALRQLEKELPLFKEKAQRGVQEQVAALKARTGKILDIRSYLRRDMDAIDKFAKEQGYDCAVDDDSNDWPTMTLGSATLVFEFKDDNDDAVTCRYLGQDTTREFPMSIASVDYERDLVPVVANFIPFAFGMEGYQVV